MSFELALLDHRPAVFGIDPGLTGAIAVLRHDGQLLDVDDMPTTDGRVTAQMLRRWLDLAPWEGHTPTVGIELVHAMPKQGVSSTFKFGATWGLVHGAFGATGHRIIDIRPQDWKKTFHIGGPRDGQKEKARRLAIERWPDHAQAFARKKDAGRAEAALIAEHTRQLLLAETGTEQS